MQKIGVFDCLAGQVQELALADPDDLQMRLQQRKIWRPQRGQETIASMLLVGIHVGPIFSRRIGWGHNSILRVYPEAKRAEPLLLCEFGGILPGLTNPSDTAKRDERGEAHQPDDPCQVAVVRAR